MKPKVKFYIFLAEIVCILMLATAAPLCLLHGWERARYIALEVAVAVVVVCTLPRWSKPNALAAKTAQAKKRQDHAKLFMQICWSGWAVGLAFLFLFVAIMTLLTGFNPDLWPVLLLYVAAVLLGAVIYQVRRWVKRDEAFAQFIAARYS